MTVSGQAEFPTAFSLSRFQPETACAVGYLRFAGYRRRYRFELQMEIQWGHNVVQGYLAHKKQHPPSTLVAVCLRPYGVPREVEVSYERGTPVGRRTLSFLKSIQASEWSSSTDIPNLKRFLLVSIDLSIDRSIFLPIYLSI